MSTIYKYNHKKKTVWSFIIALPAALVWIAAVVWKLFGISLAKQFLALNLALPTIVQFVVWVILPVWALFSAVSAYKHGTIHRYKRWNLISIFFSVLTLVLFGLIILISLL